MTTKTQKPRLGDQKLFPLVSAKLAVEISAVREQLSQLCDVARRNGRDDVCQHLTDAIRDVMDALHVTLAVEGV